MIGIPVILACLVSTAWGVSKPQRVGPAAGLEIIPIKTAAWSLAWVDLEGDGRHEVLYTDQRGLLTCQELDTGRVRWQYDLGAYCGTIRASDLDGDGTKEVLTASESFYIHAISAEGKLRWRFGGKVPLYAVVAGRLLGDGKVQVAVGGEDEKVTLLDAKGGVIKAVDLPKKGGGNQGVRLLDAGDADGDGRPELLACSIFNQIQCLDPRTGTWLWVAKPGSGKPIAGEEAGWWNLFSGGWVDSNGDSRCEAMVGSLRATVLADGAGQLLWEKPPVLNVSVESRMGLVAPVDLERDGRQEIAVLCGPELQVLDHGGEARYRSSTGIYFFNCIATSPEPKSNRVMLGSVTGSDRNLYRITFGAGGKEDGLDALREPPGRREEINNNLRKLREAVMAAPVDRVTPRRRFEVMPLAGGAPLNAIPRRAQELDQFRRAYPYDNMIFATHCGYRTGGEKKRGSLVSPEEYYALAEAHERTETCHVLAVGHSTDTPYAPAEQIEGWLSRAPKTCLGLMHSELTVDTVCLPEQEKVFNYREKRFKPLLEGHLLPAIDLAVKYRKPFHLLMKRNWWINAPAIREVYPELFTPERRTWIMANEEPSNTYSHQNDLMARVGLWKSGFVSRWAVNVINDILRTDKIYEHSPCDPHHTLRNLVAYAAAGATHYKLKVQIFAKDDARMFDLRAGEMELTPYGQLSTDIFLHLIGKGLLEVPTPENIIGVSAVGFRFAQPDPEYIRGYNPRTWDGPEAPATRAAGLFSGYQWQRSIVSPFYAASYLLGVTHHAHNIIPDTPYGLPPIIPAWFRPEGVSGIDRWWTTDGVSVIVNGQKRTAAEMKGPILQSFKEAADKMPVRATGCFWMGTRRANGTMRVTMMDNDYLDPQDLNVELTTSGPIESVRDVITGRPVAFVGKAAKIEIPAGTFRIVDVRTR